MFNNLKSNSVLIRNYLIIYVIVGLLANVLAESHRSFQQSIQSDNSYTFNRVISFGFAYHAKNSFTAQ
jgi:hypothetical protein